jgi:type III secretory pathway component EscR
LREQQLADVNRMYEDSKANYESLLQRKTQSELASNLETRQQGEQFRVLDPASLPQRPEGRILIVVVGWAAGLYLGVALLVLRTKLDKTVHGREDIAAVTDLPILARIPRIVTSRKTAYNRGLRLAEALVVISLIVSAVAGAARVYLTT